MKNNIFTILKNERLNNNTKVFLCVGTTKCIGDSLGPMVGEILSRKIIKNNIYIYGNLENNLNYNNINIILKKIYSKMIDPYLIVIDSALADKRYIGDIIINKKSMIIGKGLNKKDYKLGDVSIKGIVGENKNNNIDNFNILNSVSEEIVKKLSNDISSQIIDAIKV